MNGSSFKKVDHSMNIPNSRKIVSSSKSTTYVKTVTSIKSKTSGKPKASRKSSNSQEPVSIQGPHKEFQTTGATFDFFLPLLEIKQQKIRLFSYLLLLNPKKMSHFACYAIGAF